MRSYRVSKCEARVLRDGFVRDGIRMQAGEPTDLLGRSRVRVLGCRSSHREDVQYCRQLSYENGSGSVSLIGRALIGRARERER